MDNHVDHKPSEPTTDQARIREALRARDYDIAARLILIKAGHVAMGLATL